MRLLIWLAVLLPVWSPTLRAAPLAEGGAIAVMIAGDGRLPVFDNAVSTLMDRLRRAGAIGPSARRLSSDPRLLGRSAIQPASLRGSIEAIAGMRPGPGQACIVYATSHGVPEQGLSLGLDNEVLTPALLDRALRQGCGDAPTIVVVSSCFSGIFAMTPMTRPNRIILTAARPDRASFGCGAGRTYTVYDRCHIDAIGAGGLWQRVHAAVRRCVSAEEKREGMVPSEPQAAFGREVTDLTLPPAPRPVR